MWCEYVWALFRILCWKESCTTISFYFRYRETQPKLMMLNVRWCAFVKSVLLFGYSHLLQRESVCVCVWMKLIAKMATTTKYIVEQNDISQQKLWYEKHFRLWVKIANSYRNIVLISIHFNSNRILKWVRMKKRDRKKHICGRPKTALFNSQNAKVRRSERERRWW